jgi:hypothetical protein
VPSPTTSFPSTTSSFPGILKFVAATRFDTIIDSVRMDLEDKLLHPHEPTVSTPLSHAPHTLPAPSLTPHSHAGAVLPVPDPQRASTAAAPPLHFTAPSQTGSSSLPAPFTANSSHSNFVASPTFQPTPDALLTPQPSPSPTDPLPPRPVLPAPFNQHTILTTSPPQSNSLSIASLNLQESPSSASPPHLPAPLCPRICKQHTNLDDHVLDLHRMGHVLSFDRMVSCN